MLSNRPRGGNSGSPASTRGPATDHSDTTAPPSDRSAALGAAIEGLAELAAGGSDRDIKHAEHLTFDRAAQAMIDGCAINHQPSLKTVRRRIVKHLTPVFGGRRMAAITSADVVAYVAHRQEQGIVNRQGVRVKDVSNAEINRELQTLKRLFNLAIEQDLIASRPMATGRLRRR